VVYRNHIIPFLVGHLRRPVLVIPALLIKDLCGQNVRGRHRPLYFVHICDRYFIEDAVSFFLIAPRHISFIDTSPKYHLFSEPFSSSQASVCSPVTGQFSLISSLLIKPTATSNPEFRHLEFSVFLIFWSSGFCVPIFVIRICHPNFIVIPDFFVIPMKRGISIEDYLRRFAR
jgi:hypothetical protein